MPRPFTVLLSFPPPRDINNPYSIMLTEAIRNQDGVTALNFSWRTALTADYDVFHVHWPEILLDGRTPPRKAARQALFVALMARLRAKRIPLVRTLHNLHRPDGISAVQQRLLRSAERQTALWVLINPTSPRPKRALWDLIPHGHYKDWFAKYEVPPAVAGRIGYFGRIRRYKGVENLMRAFDEIPEDAPVSLRIAGLPSTQEQADEVGHWADRDERVGATLGFVADPDLVRHVGECELLVLPYREMHNSGAVLVALSLARPVLVPRNAANEALSAEVGPGWVWMFDGELAGSDIMTTLDALRSGQWADQPDLRLRDWDAAGADHVRAYRRAVAAAKPPTT